MSNLVTQHGDFTLERTFDASPERVFAAWADPKIKPRWFTGPDGWIKQGHSLDFRVGGHEKNGTGPPGGPFHIFNAFYHEIVPTRRIIYTYTMDMDETRSSVSLATVLFEPAGGGTRLIVTEQCVFLEGSDQCEMREQGTKGLLERLAAMLES